MKNSAKMPEKGKNASNNNEFAISDSLREKLLRFFVDGNPIDLIERDEFFFVAAKLVVQNQSVSISLLRTQFSIGNNRASHILDQLESAGILGPRTGNFFRQVLVPDETSLEHLFRELAPIEMLEDEVIESFYERNKEEIELLRIEYERNKIIKLKKIKEEAVQAVS